VLALIFFLISFFFVYYSFYGMRIGVEVRAQEEVQATAD
jgi:hypothetical protein